MDFKDQPSLTFGIDTVAIGGIATGPLFPMNLLKSRTSGIRTRRLVRGGISLFVSVWKGQWSFRLQTSLPRLVYGENFHTVPLDRIGIAVEKFLLATKKHFPELEAIPLELLSVRRVDISFDFVVQATTALIHAFRNCYLSKRKQPGFIYSSKGSESYYSKDTRGKRPPRYRSLIAYPKCNLAFGVKGLRIEARFHSAYLSQGFGNDLTLLQLAGHGLFIAKGGWKYIEDQFSLLEPAHDYSLEMSTRGARLMQREFLLSFGYLAREVPLDRLEPLFLVSGKFDVRPLKKYKIGYGDSSIPELVKFAEIREEWKMRFSTSYKNNDWIRAGYCRLELFEQNEFEF